MPAPAGHGGALEALPEELAIGEPGERVVERLEAQLLLVLVPFADVADVEDDASHGRVIQRDWSSAPRHGASRRRGGGPAPRRLRWRRCRRR